MVVQQLRHPLAPLRLQRFQADGVGHIEGPAKGAVQPLNPGAAIQSLAHIFREGTNISALGAEDFDVNLRLGARPKVQQVDPVNGHRPGLALDLFTFPGQFVQRLAVEFERREHGRNLLNIPHKLLQRPLYLFAGHARGVGLVQHLTLGITGAGDHAQAKRALVTLLRIQQKLGKFGGLTKAQR